MTPGSSSRPSAAIAADWRARGCSVPTREKSTLSRLAGGRRQTQQVDRLDSNGSRAPLPLRTSVRARSNIGWSFGWKSASGTSARCKSIGECRHIRKRRGQVGDLVEEIQDRRAAHGLCSGGRSRGSAPSRNAWSGAARPNPGVSRKRVNTSPVPSASEVSAATWTHGSSMSLRDQREQDVGRVRRA